jgi:hypothetical protein
LNENSWKKIEFFVAVVVVFIFQIYEKKRENINKIECEFVFIAVDPLLYVNKTRWKEYKKSIFFLLREMKMKICLFSSRNNFQIFFLLLIVVIVMRYI